MSRRGSEKRRLDKILPLRMTGTDRSIFDELARREGFKTTQQFVLSRFSAELEAAREAGLAKV